MQTPLGFKYMADPSAPLTIHLVLDTGQTICEMDANTKGWITHDEPPGTRDKARMCYVCSTVARNAAKVYGVQLAQQAVMVAQARGLPVNILDYTASEMGEQVMDAVLATPGLVLSDMARQVLRHTGTMLIAQLVCRLIDSLSSEASTKVQLFDGPEHYGHGRVYSKGDGRGGGKK